MSISVDAANIYRDHEVTGNPLSGAHEPIKSQIRGLFVTINDAVTAAAIAGGVTVFKTTRALLNADLAHVANTLALVYADPTSNNNDYYLKVGASGSGSWTKLGLLLTQDIADQLAEAIALYPDMVAAAASAAASAASALASKNAATASQIISQSSATSSAASATSAAASASAAGPVAIYTTKAEANADLASIPNLGVVEVMIDETRTNSRTRYRKESGVLVYKITLYNLVERWKSTDSLPNDPKRCYARITAPFNGTDAWIDNVLALQNLSQGQQPPNTIGGNAAMIFLDVAGTERGAVGYSRNSTLTEFGYYPDALYIETGCAFIGDANPSSFMGICTQHPDAPAFANTSFIWMHQHTLTGKMTIQSRGAANIELNTRTGTSNGSTSGTGYLKVTSNRGARVGDIGNPNYIWLSMQNSNVRMRERDNVDQFAITTNLSEAIFGGGVTQDDVSISSWMLTYGGGLDEFSLSRWAPGATLDNARDEIFTVKGTGQTRIGQNGLSSAGKDGMLSVTAASGINSAITAVNTVAATSTVRAWNQATTGDNKFVHFYTEGTITERGFIDYNRAGGVVRYNTTSDYRVKTIVGDLTSALASVEGMKVYTGFIGDGTQEVPFFVAHELADVAPWAVSGQKDAVDADGNMILQGVDASTLVPMLVQAIKELTERVKQLEAGE